MGYLKEFQMQIDNQQFANFMRLWEEYCQIDVVDGPELIKILQMIKNSKIAPLFGPYTETVLPLWEQIPNDEKSSDHVLKLILDLQTTNSPKLADLATELLRNKYQNQKNYNEKIRIVGLRNRDKFQGAISNFELLNHMEKGNFVFHTGGWSVGEIIEVSLVREHLVLEFEGIAGRKDISFENGFKNLIPIPSDHFLARRFGDPDKLEKEGKADPVSLIKILLRDMGPKSASEIKDELCDLVIPDADWTKWWQNARNKIKKDTQIRAPDNLKEPFALREKELTHEDRFKQDIVGITDINEAILATYNLIRDFSETLKNQEFKEHLKQHLLNLLTQELPAQKNKNEIKDAQKLQILFLLEDLDYKNSKETPAQAIESIEKIDLLIDYIDIAAFKKRTLMIIRERKNEWSATFLKLLFLVPQNSLRDYVFKELMSDASTKEAVKTKISELIHKSTIYPEAFLWYFQKVIGEEDVPFNDKVSSQQFLEAFLTLLHYVEQKPECRELVKKMHNIITAKRYAMVRSIIEGASIEYLHEFLLLVSKCQSLDKQDLRILQSLAEVVQPSMVNKKKDSLEHDENDEIIWTTSTGYQKIQERIQHIGTVETVENAREIEEARAHGDLRENSEYKFALERRTRLQSELKMLTKQLNKARILTKDDISRDEVGVGSIVQVISPKGDQLTYTLLGPWDANPDDFILSFQSKLAQAMIGRKVGDKFVFQGENYVIKDIKSYFDSP